MYEPERDTFLFLSLWKVARQRSSSLRMGIVPLAFVLNVMNSMKWAEAEVADRDRQIAELRRQLGAGVSGAPGDDASGDLDASSQVIGGRLELVGWGRVIDVDDISLADSDYPPDGDASVFPHIYAFGEIRATEGSIAPMEGDNLTVQDCVGTTRYTQNMVSFEDHRFVCVE